MSLLAATFAPYVPSAVVADRLAHLVAYASAAPYEKTVEWVRLAVTQAFHYLGGAPPKASPPIPVPTLAPTPVESTAPSANKLIYTDWEGGQALLVEWDYTLYPAGPYMSFIFTEWEGALTVELSTGISVPIHLWAGNVHLTDVWHVDKTTGKVSGSIHFANGQLMKFKDAKIQVVFSELTQAKTTAAPAVAAAPALPFTSHELWVILSRVYLDSLLLSAPIPGGWQQEVISVINNQVSHKGGTPAVDAFIKYLEGVEADLNKLGGPASVETLMYEAAVRLGVDISQVVYLQTLVLQTLPKPGITITYATGSAVYPTDVVYKTLIQWLINMTEGGLGWLDALMAAKVGNTLPQLLLTHIHELVVKAQMLAGPAPWGAYLTQNVHAQVPHPEQLVLAIANLLGVAKWAQGPLQPMGFLPPASDVPTQEWLTSLQFLAVEGHYQLFKTALGTYTRWMALEMLDVPNLSFEDILIWFGSHPLIEVPKKLWDGPGWAIVAARKWIQEYGWALTLQWLADAGYAWDGEKFLKVLAAMTNLDKNIPGDW